MQSDLRQEEAKARNKIHLCLLSLANSHGNKQLTTNDSNTLAKILLVCFAGYLPPRLRVEWLQMHYTCSNPRAGLTVEQDRMATRKGGQAASHKQQYQRREFREQYSNLTIKSCSFPVSTSIIYITWYVEVTASRSKRKSKGQPLIHNVTYYPNLRVPRRWGLLIYLVGIWFIHRNYPGHLEEQRSESELLQKLRQSSPDRY